MAARLPGLTAFVVTLAVLGLGWWLLWEGPTECVDVPPSDCAAVSAAARHTEFASNLSSLVIDPAPLEWAGLGPTSAYPSYDRAEWRVMVDEARYVACWRDDGGITCVGPHRGVDSL